MTLTQIVAEGDIYDETSPAEILNLSNDFFVDLVYIDPPFFTQRDHGEFDDRWESVDTYSFEIARRVATAWENWMAPNSNLIVHCDWRASHYVKSSIDMFGSMRKNLYDNFKNEIVWSYNSGGASKRHLSRKHDVLLWWAKGDNYTFNVQREPYATPNVSNRAGFHPDGRMLTDVWEIPFISTTSSERTGYPTQKPLALLKRVVEIFSNPGDTVLDFYAGSGTTGVAAKELGRGYVLLDRNPNAVKMCRERLSEV